MAFYFTRASLRPPQRILSLLIFLTILITMGSAYGQETDTAPIDFSADIVSSDGETGILIATGNVVLTQGESKLTADKVEYDRTQGVASASGNVVFTDKNGNAHYAERIVLDKNFSYAFAEPVISQLVDGSWIGAEKIGRNQDNSTLFTGSRFTPCNCNFREGETPVWELQTSTTEHNPAEQKFYHKHVRMYIFSVPVMYLPFLSHPDHTVRRQSGFLEPRIAYSSDLGTTYAQSYYWVTGDTHDAEIRPHYFSTNGDALDLKYRQFWDQSALNVRVIGGRLNTFKKNRENVFGTQTSFSTTLGDDWKVNALLHHASQDTFLRRYDFDESETLKSFITTERIENNRYSLVETYNIQDLESDSHSEREPFVLPYIFHERYLESPRDDTSIRLRFGAANINNDNFTDVNRWTSEVYMLQENVSEYGILTTEGRLSAQLRNIETAPGGSGYTGDLGQASGSVALGWSRPISTVVGDRYMLIEPKAKLVSTRATDHNDNVPNLDSADFRLDEANLFLINREQGEDYSITHSRFDTGVSASIYDESFGNLSGFIGSSRRLSGQHPQGLNAVSDDDKYSDILASLTIEPDDYFSLSWAGRFQPRNFRSNETRTKAKVKYGGTSFSLTYNQIAESFFDTANEEQEQLIISANQELPGNWAIKWAQEYDMVDNRRELIDSSIEMTFAGGIQDCLNISIGYNRDATTDRDIKPADEIYFTLTFKYLGSTSSREFGS